MNNSILIIAEHAEGKIKPVTYEAIASAISIRQYTNLPIKIILPGYNVSDLADDIAEKSGMDILVIENENLERYSAEGYKTALTAINEEFHPTFICIPHSPTGYDFAPVLAVRLKGCCISGVENLKMESDKIIFTRSIWHGKLKMDVASPNSLAVITVLPGSFKFDFGNTARKGSISMKKIPVPLANTKSINIKKSVSTDKSLNIADIIVSAGRGIEKKDNIVIIQDFAKIFTKSAVGCSRAVCDLGWLDYKAQIGATGKTVAPRLYVACGISGASQHISGMIGSQNIVSINRDPYAAIFQISDVCIVEDLKTFIPLFIEEAEKRKTDL